MIDVESFYKVYRTLSSKNKKIKIFEGSHAIARPKEVYKEAVEFLIFCFLNKKMISKKILKNSVQSKKLFYI